MQELCHPLDGAGMLEFGPSLGNVAQAPHWGSGEWWVNGKGDNVLPAGDTWIVAFMSLPSSD